MNQEKQIILIIEAKDGSKYQGNFVSKDTEKLVLILSNVTKTFEGKEEKMDLCELKKEDIAKISMIDNTPKKDEIENVHQIPDNKKQENSEYQKYILDASIGTAVRASSSFPAVFCPYEYKNHIFLDGGTTDNIPVNEVFNLGADKVITVNFEPIRINSKSNVIDIVMRTIDIMGNKIIEKELEKSDYILTIPTENDIGLLDINKIKDCYKCGYETTKKKKKKIEAIIF